jgi:hypothetical protein
MAEVQVETKEDLTTSKGDAGKIQIWTAELENSSNKEKDFREEGKQYLEVYRDEKKIFGGFGESAERYNVFWSNTQTLRPLVFSNLPAPNITRRFLDKDENSRILSEMMERALNYFSDQNNTNEVYNKIRDDFLIPGRGVSRVIFDPAEVVEVEGEELLNEETGEIEVSKVEELDLDTKKVRNEYVPWEDLRLSPENVWEQVRWIAFKHKMTRDQLVDQFGAIGKEVELTESCLTNLDNDTKEHELFKLAEVWEIWDKIAKRVIFLTKGQYGKILSDEEDPYNLQGFFPIAKPLGSSSDPSSLTPIPLYRMYKSQAAELNQVDARIKSLIQQCKFTGVYASTSEDADIANLLNGEDGEFNPLTGVQPGQNINNSVFTKDIVTIANVINQLNVQKANILQNIRDITGLSDIVRGTTLANETATAQRLKGDFAISRIQPLQKEMEVNIRNTERLMAELIVENYTGEELAKITNLEIVDINAIKDAAVAQATSLIQQADPKNEEESELIKAQAEKFINNSLEEPLNKLKGYAVTPEQLRQIDILMNDDKLRSFSVDVETDSTVRIDQNQEKASRLEFSQAIGSYASNFFPLVQAGILTPTAFNEMLMFIARPYKVGRNLEEYLVSGEEVNQEPEGPSIEEQLAQAENSRKDQEVQLKAQEVNIKQQLADVEKAKVKQSQLQFEDNLEFEDVNKAEDRRAKTTEEMIQNRTDRVTSLIRESDLLGAS